MENFNEIVDEVLEHSLQQLQIKQLDIESILSIYYISQHLKSKDLTNQNKLLINKIISEVRNNLAFKLSIDIKYLIFWILLNIINDIKNEDKYLKSFFSVYLFFDEYSNIIENKELIKILFPDEKIDLFLEYLHEIVRGIAFWDFPLLDKQKIIYNTFYITCMIYERTVDPFKKHHSFLYEIFLEAIKRDDAEIVFYLYTPLQFTWNGVSSTQREFKMFNETIEKNLESYISNKLIDKYKLETTEREINKTEVIKVVFLQERLINYSINNVFYSLLKNLSENKNNKFEFIVMDLNFKEFGGSQEYEQNRIQKLGFKVIDCHKMFSKDSSFVYLTINKVLKIRKWLVENKIDILIGMHSRPEYNFLFTSRTCPIQIYWSHGNYEYNIKNIDINITHSSIPEICTHDYKCFSFEMDHEKYNPVIDLEEIKRVRNMYSSKKYILGSIGRLSKLSEEYLELIGKIMESNPNTIYLACGSGDQNRIRKIVDDSGFGDRFFFTGHINSHLYGNIIDLLLSPFPYGGGESLYEFAYKGKPFVYMGSNQNLKHNNKFDFIESYEKNIKMYIKKDLYNSIDLYNIKKYGYLIPENKYAKFYSFVQTVYDIEDYEKVANKFINDRSFVDKVVDEFLNTNHEFNDSFISVMEKNI